MLRLLCLCAALLLLLRADCAHKTYTRVPIQTLSATTAAALQKLGHSKHAAEVITDTLIYAELRANNQGLMKLVTGGLGFAECTPVRTTFETPVSAQLDGGRNVGMVVLDAALNQAIAKAKKSGICVVGCSNYSSATGALGCWAQRAAEQGLIGVVITQCSEMVAPHGSFEPIFGTNPIAVGLPLSPPLVLDMATSACAWYGLKTALAEGGSIPDNVAYDSNGRPTTDPAEALRGALRVFDRSYKGSHIALMVELLAGALTGAAMENKGAAGNWGSLVLVLDPALLGPSTPEEFRRRSEQMCDRVRNAKRLEGEGEGEGGQGKLLLPGERGDQAAAANLRLGSVPVLDSVYAELRAIAGV
ncbi:Malate/L-lactate dehydrogenase [Ochromonadaceae sp. CCMP2298]|nr:Malate/L-lactate dehydrogenase [Ochromonadaceae sp. CCMP2298]